MELIIVTGLSGAGKSHAKNCLEDLGYYCIDNMPPVLMGNFVRIASESKAKLSKLAFCTDIRGGEFFDDLVLGIEALKEMNVDYKIMFLEASDSVLINRYKETRRAHPLAPDGNIQQGINIEREKLAEVRKHANYIIDTSSSKVANLNAEIKRLLDSEDVDTFKILIESFGFKNGLPPEADWVLDVRFLPNPYYVPSLKSFTGKNKKIKEYVLACPDAGIFAGRITGLVLDLIPSYIREGKYQMTLAIGCTGGRHRSVVMTEEIARRLNENGRHATIKHRDCDR